MVGLVEGPVDWSGWGRGFGQGKAFELGCESVDVALKLARSDGVAGSGEGSFPRRCEHAGADGSLVRGAGGVVTFDDLGADSLA